MRSLFALLLVLLPLSAPSAAVVVNATINNAAPLTCSNANSISYALGNNVFRYTCATDGVTRSCTPTQTISYNLGTQAINVTCNNGTTQGLIVDAIMDGGQNGNGLGGTCTAATAFAYDLNQAQFTWACGQVNVGCFPLSDALYDLVLTKVTFTCSASNSYIYSNGFEN